MSVICRRIISLFAGILLAAGFLAQAQQENVTVVARAGGVFISEREFQERFELTPGLYRHRKPQLEQEKLTFLYSLIAEKLLAQEALARGLDTAAVFRAGMADLVKLFARDELYRREVRQKVFVSGPEVKEGMLRARQQLLVNYMYFPDETGAGFVRSHLRTGKNFDRHVLDASLQALRDTATVLWGDADTTIESAAYRLGADDVSPVIHAGEGWYILRLRRVERNALYADLSLQTLRERVEIRLRIRKERVREEEFMEEVLRNRISYSPPALYRAVGEAVAAVFRRHYAPPSVALTPAMASEVLDRLPGKEADTLIIAGTTSWTVAEAVSRLAALGFTVNGDSVRGVAARLFSVFRDWSRQELMAQEAAARRLDRSPEVQQQLAPWRDHYLAGMTERRIHDVTRVSDAEVYAYLRSTDASLPVPEVQLRVLRTLTARDMQEAFHFLEQGGTFVDAVRRYSIDTTAATGGVTPWLAITERPPLGAIAARLDSGQFYGPLRDSTGFLYIQLLRKRNGRRDGDTSFTGRFGRASRDLLDMKSRRAVTLFTAQSAARLGYDIYMDRLKMLKVTPLPMLAYRFLGFGGRMFEVPFVSPKVEWLDAEPPREHILP
jgi:hypothetical protein